MTQNYTRQQVIDGIIEMQKQRQALRSSVKDMVFKSKTLNPWPLVGSDDLRGNLEKILPKYLVPTNVGSLNQVMYPQWYEVEFNLGTNQAFGSTFKQVQTFQVKQEAAFLMCTMSRAFKDTGRAGFGAPLQVTIRDKQSSRQFNDSPIPLQMLGYYGKEFRFETPFLFMPTSTIEIELTCWIDPSIPAMPTVGDNYQEISFGGIRVSPDDAKFLTEQLFL